METFIEDISAQLGVSQNSVREAIKVVLTFAQKKLPAEEFQRILAHVPGAETLLSSVSSAEAPASSLGSLFGGLGGLLSGQAAEAAKAYADLQAAGLPSSKIVPFVQVFLTKAREVAGNEAIDSLLTKVPLLRNFVSQS